MGDDMTTGDRLDDLSDREWADAILERARERSAAEDFGVSLGDDPFGLVDPDPPDPETAGESATPGSPISPEGVVVDPRPGLVTREEIDPSFEPPLYQDPIEPFPTVPPPVPPDLGLPGAQRRVGRAALEWGAVIVGALVMALLVKAFLFQAYYIPSPSMEPTLGEGDRIIVNKVSYRLHDVNRGDLVVFEAPEGTGGVDDLIKRVVGLPGEFIRVANGRVLIDNGMLLEPYLPLQDGTAGLSTSANCANLPGDVDGCRVPPGHVFVLGDHRTNSRDSRFFGPIPEDSIRGRAFLRIWPLGEMRRL
ncbi:MAG: signal peptidase I [Acidimicrobiales bacterium]|nr:signal peptidase I [Acidimicrobiales bacterium]